MKKILCCLPFLLMSLVALTQNIGIGESNPAAKLQVKATDSAALIVQNGTSSGLNVKTGLFFKTGIYYSGAIASIGSAATHRLAFYTFGGSLVSSLKERLTILDDGKIGINNPAPVAQLDIAGNLRIADGTEGAGKVLTSNAIGHASWKPVSSPAVNTAFKVFTPSNDVYPGGGGSQRVMPFAVGQGLIGNFDDGNNIDNTEHAFVAPSDGVYHFDVLLATNSVSTVSANTVITMTAVGFGSNYVANQPKYTINLLPGNLLPNHMALNWTTRLVAGDRIEIWFYHTMPTPFYTTYCSFSGSRIY